jgi:transposase
MLFISKMTEAETITLQQMERYHPLVWTRIRANALLQSNEYLTLQLIADIHGVCRQTVSSWLHAWEEQGLCGLIDKSRSGRIPLIPNEAEQKILKIIENSPRSLKRVLDDISDQLGITITLSTLKRLCKRAKLSWKRVRKSLKNKRDPEKFAQSVKMIEGLIAQEENGESDLYFFDESGFTLEPCIPYAWQAVNETIELPSSKSKRLNVLGFVNRACQFESFVFEGSVNTSVVVACFDEFAKTIKKPTTIIIDNAPTHTSKEFKGNIEKWKLQGLNVEPIAPYSPELNIIEIVWRKIKYEWLPFSAYQSYDSLKQSLFDILKNIGISKYHIIQFT